jgi:hypothetical protein
MVGIQELEKAEAHHCKSNNCHERTPALKIPFSLHLGIKFERKITHSFRNSQIMADKSA